MKKYAKIQFVVQYEALVELDEQDVELLLAPTHHKLSWQEQEERTKTFAQKVFKNLDKSTYNPDTLEAYWDYVDESGAKIT